MNLLVAGTTFAPRATKEALLTNPITGIKVDPNVVKPSTALPTAPSGCIPVPSLTEVKISVTSLLIPFLESWLNVASKPAPTVSNIP